MQFQSTHPLRGATGGSGRHNSAQRFQSTHPLRGATWYKFLTFLLKNFNPRTPCGVRHGRSLDIVEAQTDFNPRTPCGVRLIKNDDISSRNRFQSTHPLRGATNFHTKTFLSKIFQSTHPLRGATRINSMRAKLEQISIHAPLAGCDFPKSGQSIHKYHFNPRTPCGVRPV